jgi:septal ring factor EnvC (AmiA/AmiB activator)
MVKGAKFAVIGLFVIVLAASLLVTGCTRYANEEQLGTMDESEAAAIAAEENVAELEKEKAELQAKLDEKKKELEEVKAEHKKVAAKLAE